MTVACFRSCTSRFSFYFNYSSHSRSLLRKVIKSDFQITKNLSVLSNSDSESSVNVLSPNSVDYSKLEKKVNALKSINVGVLLERYPFIYPPSSDFETSYRKLIESLVKERER
jgi:hypothetical protein